MAASNEELESAAEDALETSLGSGIKRWRNREREIEYTDPKNTLDTILKLRGLQSSRRGIRVAKIDRPS